MSPTLFRVLLIPQALIFRIPLYACGNQYKTWEHKVHVRGLIFATYRFLICVLIVKVSEKPCSRWLSIQQWVLHVYFYLLLSINYFTKKNCLTANEVSFARIRVLQNFQWYMPTANIVTLNSLSLLQQRVKDSNRLSPNFFMYIYRNERL